MNTRGPEPPDVMKALSSDPAVRTLWKDLTPLARRDFLRWIAEAKQASTRAKRIAQLCDVLVQGKRRPCCFNLVPFDLLDGIKATPKVKAKWEQLDGDARRDFIDWIVDAPDKGSRTERIQRSCAMIAAGKQQP